MIIKYGECEEVCHKHISIRQEFDETANILEGLGLIYQKGCEGNGITGK